MENERIVLIRAKIVQILIVRRPFRIEIARIAPVSGELARSMQGAECPRQPDRQSLRDWRGGWYGERASGADWDAAEAD